jgi:hypothetical protein
MQVFGKSKALRQSRYMTSPVALASIPCNAIMLPLNTERCEGSRRECSLIVVKSLHAQKP